MPGAKSKVCLLLTEPDIFRAANISAASKNLTKTGKIRRWLRAADFEGVRREKKNTPGTCEWIIKNEKFGRWKGYGNPGFLWTHGIPGNVPLWCVDPKYVRLTISKAAERLSWHHFSLIS
jgi:hypothetical protein